MMASKCSVCVRLISPDLTPSRSILIGFATRPDPMMALTSGSSALTMRWQ